MTAAAERVVVGVDDGHGSLAALRWAVEEAARRQAVLEVVHAVDLAPIEDVHYDHDLLVDRARGRVQQLVHQATVDELGEPPSVIVEIGRPAEVLLDRSAGADLLVVGSRGLGGFAGLLLGSVSRQAVHRAVCPTVVVPSRRAQTR